MSSLDNLVYGRRSIRKYKPDMPSMEWIHEMILCAGRAPSPSNSQPVRFIRIDSKKTKERISRTMTLTRERFLREVKTRVLPKKIRNRITSYYRFSEFMFGAPVVFAVGTVKSFSSFSKKLFEAGILERDKRGDTDEDISVGLALGAFLLKGEELGLGSCILTAPLVFIPCVEDILGVQDVSVKCFVTTGFPDEEPGLIERKGLSDIYSEI